MPFPLNRAHAEGYVATRARSRAIGRELRNRWSDTVEQPVPNDMLDILRAIDAKRSAA